eukprot:TRINITY_DN46048_c0_g1_i1.p1 TRINITY_DN46048_c0_g1~~TRINITY_DN46048_c0_g1_i1.p1  ORF type:complete len:525 (+),score=139.24 TRINITY_DN46048_c0_g1_i1:113-1687(+)
MRGPLLALAALLDAAALAAADGVFRAEPVPEDGGWPVPLLTFGLIADPHANINHRQPWWCDLECWRREVKLARSPKGRKHHLVLRKINESVHVLATVPGVAFSVNVGDLCDMDMLVNMPPVLDLWDRLPHPHYNLMGNHDLRAENDRFGEPPRRRNTTQIAWLLREWRLQGDTFYYEFREGPFRFIVLDSMTLPPTERGSPLKDKQVRWLAARLDEAAAAGDDVIIFAHIPIGLATNDIRHILLKHDNILAVFHGHKHKGGYYYDTGTGKHMITLQGMIETDVNAFGYANVFADRIELVGFGRVPSRVYFRTAKQSQRARERPAAAYRTLWERFRGVTPYSQAEVGRLLAAAGSGGGSAGTALGPARPLPRDLSQKQLLPLKMQTDTAALARLSCGKNYCPLAPPRRRRGGPSALTTGGGAVADWEPQRPAATPRPTPEPPAAAGPTPAPPRRAGAAAAGGAAEGGAGQRARTPPLPQPAPPTPPVYALPMVLSGSALIAAAGTAVYRLRRVAAARRRRLMTPC